ncbi:MAG: sodium:calcium symporter, partial [Puniceicoccales bacterium]
DDDVVLSGLAATSANEFCEVALGGLITVPAAVAFIGVAGLAGVGLGTFDLGFKVLPLVFSEMPFGNIFGFLWFFLLFLAAMTSSISMLQPGIAFIEEALKTDRKSSTAILGFITAIGSGFVVYFSEGIKALDTLDFWVGTFLIFVLATMQILIFGWVVGVRRGRQEAHIGAAIRIPGIYVPIMKVICPLFLIVIFVLWVLTSVFGINLTGDGESHLSGYVTDLFVDPNPVAWMSVALVAILAGAFALIISTVQRYKDIHKKEADS